MEKKTERIRISHIYILFIVALVAAGAFLLTRSLDTEKSITKMQEITREYTDGQKAIHNLMSASDYLTDQARTFVVSGNPENGVNYQEEVEVVQRRDKALDTIRNLGGKQKVYTALGKALNESNQLMEREYYAMLLAAVGHKLKKKDYEAFVADAELTEEDLKLSNAEKISKATQLMFDEEYDEKKEAIRSGVSESLNSLIDELGERQVKSYDEAVKHSQEERITFIIILAAFFLIMALTAWLIINPLEVSTKKIESREPLPVKGAEEFYRFAEAYNDMLEKSEEHQEQLSYEATHDELTGLYNRKMFEQKKAELAHENIAMLILDVDHFKEINDTYGHEAGDMVLRKISAALTASFRLEDCICRIGGDEFVVLMRQVDSTLKYVVRDKIRMVQEKLMMKDDLPPATLSIGVAFSDDKGIGEGEDNLFKRADKALYSIKEHGRDGYAFYGDM